MHLHRLQGSPEAASLYAAAAAEKTAAAQKAAEVRKKLMGGTRKLEGEFTWASSAAGQQQAEDSEAEAEAETPEQKPPEQESSEQESSEQETRQGPGVRKTRDDSSLSMWG